MTVLEGRDPDFTKLGHSAPGPNQEFHGFDRFWRGLIKSDQKVVKKVGFLGSQFPDFGHKPLKIMVLGPFWTPFWRVFGGFGGMAGWPIFDIY